MASTFKRAQCILLLFLFFFFLLVLCAEIGNCLGGQIRPRIVSSSLFQTAGEDLYLHCIPTRPIRLRYNLVFRVDGTVVFNSHDKYLDEGVYRHNDTSVCVEHPKVIRREIDPKTYLPNVDCSFDDVTSWNSLNIPYYNIDKFSSHVPNQQSGVGQAANISCEMSLNPVQSGYSVRFVSGKKMYFEVNVRSTTQSTIQYDIHYHTKDFVILGNNIRQVYHWTTVSIKIGPTKKYNGKPVRMQCELLVPNVNDKKPIIRSKDYSFVEFD